jgi:glyoxylase-like metal-dependent hydrolase (beta-lactamase superfamily II)
VRHATAGQHWPRSWRGARTPHNLSTSRFRVATSEKEVGWLHTGPTFEVTGKPWFGPRKRARELLEQHRADIAAPADAVNLLRAALGGRADTLEQVRFIDFRMNGAFRFTIALCWLASDPEARQALYDAATEVVAASGWYPLPQGERLGSVHAMRSYPSTAAGLSVVGEGELNSLQSAVDVDGGCAVRVSLKCGDSLLLDSGLPGQLRALESDRLVLVSHLDRDHLGGVESGGAPGLPVVLSAGTVRMLDACGRLSAISKTNRVVVMEPGEGRGVGKDLQVEMFAVPHLPGSVGYVLESPQHTLIFSGDISLKSARHDFLPALIARIPTDRQCTVMLDGTMAGRHAGASMTSVGDTVAALDESDVVVLGDNSDYLLYAYLDLFDRIQHGPRRHGVSFLATWGLRHTFEVLHDAFIRRDIAALDPFLEGQYKQTMSSWAESRWLYWLDHLTSVPDGRRVWFLTQADWPNFEVPGRPFVITVGRKAPPSGVRTADLDTTPWTLHSGASALAESIDALDAHGAKVVLFHNFPKRIQKFAATAGINAVPLAGTIILDE